MRRVVHGLSIALLPLAACLPVAHAPVAERSIVEATPAVYQVGRHDSLYSIAWRFNLDYKELAALNNIDAPHTIYEGQRLRLTSIAGKSRQPSRPERPGDAHPPPTHAESPVPMRRSKPPPVAGTQLPATPPASRRAAKTANPSAATGPTARPPSSPSQAKAAAKPAPRRPAAPPAVLATVSPDGWRRPVTERPVRRFGGASKGFDYQLGPATQIHAASGGIVVYAGPGLGGFRHLVIVKASDRYLVAYGVNVKPALQEGETVLPGTVVAKMESGGPTAGKFHFEIRDRGKPIDPGPLIRG